MTHVPWLVESLSLFGLSLAATVVALRGRRVGDHPFCRRCGFDLFGKPPASSVCSECGAELASRKAVRIGRRQRQTRLLAVAGPALVLATGWTAWDGWRATRGVDWNRHKPDWWLARAANSGNPATQDGALMELARRIGEGQLPQGRVDALVRRGLEVQADRSRPWVPAWGTLVEAAHDTGSLTKQQWLRYMTQAVTLVLEPERASIRRCDALRLRLRTGPDRVGAVSVTHGQAVEAQRLGVYADTHFLIEGREVALDGIHDLSFPRFTMSPVKSDQGLLLFQPVTYTGPVRPTSAPPVGVSIGVFAAPPDWLADGRHAVRLRIRLVPLRSERDDRNSFSSIFVPAGDAQSVEVGAPCTIIPAARLNRDLALRSEIQHGLSVDRVVYRVIGRSDRLEGFLRCDGTPIPLAYRISLRYDDGDSLAGAACFTPGGPGGAIQFGSTIYLPKGPPATVDVVLAPDRALAPPEVTEIWGGVIILESVPVVREDAPSGRTKATGGR